MADDKNTTQLIRYDAACLAIANAKTVDEVKQIRNSGAALAAYARIAKNKQLEADAAEIRIRAERRVGEMMAAQRATVGLAKGGGDTRSTGSKSDPVKPKLVPALADAGIDKHLADTARCRVSGSDDRGRQKVGRRARHTPPPARHGWQRGPNGAGDGLPGLGASGGRGGRCRVPAAASRRGSASQSSGREGATGAEARATVSTRAGGTARIPTAPAAPPSTGGCARDRRDRATRGLWGR